GRRNASSSRATTSFAPICCSADGNAPCRCRRSMTTIHKMNPEVQPDNSLLVEKIARLVQERGWNQEDFARIANLNRQTVRQILHADASRKLRNATVSTCARALGLTVNELRQIPLERLLPRMNSAHVSEADARLRRLYERATQPELLAWLDRNPERG